MRSALLLPAPRMATVRGDRSRFPLRVWPEPYPVDVGWATCCRSARWVHRPALARQSRRHQLTSELLVGKAENVSEVVHQPGLHQVVRSNVYGLVIVADGLARERTRTLAWRKENRPLELMCVPRATDVAGLWFAHLGLPRFSVWRLWLKRAFDAVFSAIARAMLAPVVVAVAVANKLDYDGPVLFRQTRVCRFGPTFAIHKFRTMCVDAESEANDLIAALGGTALLFKLENDTRITWAGRFLRKYSIDELPQFWMALRGGMSVVGPRPQVAHEVAEYIDRHHRRVLIKPGITGLWQVNGRSKLSMAESIRLDLRHVENWSLIADVVIILKTVGVVLRPNERSELPATPGRARECRRNRTWGPRVACGPTQSLDALVGADRDGAALPDSDGIIAARAFDPGASAGLYREAGVSPNASAGTRWHEPRFTHTTLSRSRRYLWAWGSWTQSPPMTRPARSVWDLSMQKRGGS